MSTEIFNIRRVCLTNLNMPTHKLRYALTTGLLRGITKTFVAYGIPLNDNTFNVFFDIVGELLSGNPEIEYEWSAEEYSRMMEIKSLWN